MYKRNRIKDMGCLLVILGILLGTCVNAKAGIAFDSPKDALEYFMDEIRGGDIEGALEAFPIERAAREFNFDGFVDRMASWQESYVMRYPSNSEVFYELNRCNLLADRMEEVTNFVFSFVADPMFLESTTLIEKDSVIKDTMNVIDAEAISEIEVVRMDYFIPEVQDNESCSKNRIKWAEDYGADNLYEYLVLYRLDGQLFYNAINFIEYQEDYYIWQLCGNLAGLNIKGYAVPTTEHGYLEELER